MVRDFVTEGANVMMGARHPGQAADVIKEIDDDRFVFAQLDVRDELQWIDAFETPLANNPDTGEPLVDVSNFAMPRRANAKEIQTLIEH